MLQTNFGIKVGGMIVALSAIAWAQAPSGPAPVVVEGRTLFTVQTSLGPFTARDRAVATSGRLTLLAKDLTASLDAIAAVEGETSTDVTLGDRVLLTVTDADARAAGKSRRELVAEYIKSIQSAVAALRAEYSARSLLKGALYTLLITAGLIALLMLLRRLRSALVTRLQGLRIRPIRLQQVELISAQQIKQILIQATRDNPPAPDLDCFLRVCPARSELLPVDAGIRSKAGGVCGCAATVRWASNPRATCRACSWSSSARSVRTC